MLEYSYQTNTDLYQIDDQTNECVSLDRQLNNPPVSTQSLKQQGNKGATPKTKTNEVKSLKLNLYKIATEDEEFLERSQ